MPDTESQRTHGFLTCRHATAGVSPRWRSTLLLIVALTSISAPARGAEAAAEPAPEADAETFDAGVDPIFRSPAAETPAPTVHRSQSRSLARRNAVEDTRVTFKDVDSQRLARQLELEEYEPVLEQATRKIETIERDEQRYAEALVEPLLLQGDALAGLGRYDAALESYSRAVHVQRVSTGLNAPEQVAAVYREANALKLLGQLRDANDREEYAFGVLQRTYGPLSPKLLPGLYHLASWYNQTYNIFQARRLYEQAVNIVEASYGSDSEMLIEGLEGIAQTYFRERFPPFFASGEEVALTNISTPGNTTSPYLLNARPLTVNNYSAGERALERVVMLRAQQEDVPPEQLADAYLKLADWHLLFEKIPQRASALPRSNRGAGGGRTRRREGVDARTNPAPFPPPR